MKYDRWPILIVGGLVLAACSSAPPDRLDPYRIITVAGTPGAVARCVQTVMVAHRYRADLTTGEPVGAAYDVVVRGGTPSVVTWKGAFRAAGPGQTHVQVWRDYRFPQGELMELQLQQTCAGRMD